MAGPKRNPHLELENRNWSTTSRIIVGTFGLVLLILGILGRGWTRWPLLAVALPCLVRVILNKRFTKMMHPQRPGA